MPRLSQIDDILFPVEEHAVSFNAITDFASHPHESRCVRRDRHSFQRLAGTWLVQFNQECRMANFQLSEHLAKLAKGNGEQDDEIRRDALTH